MIEKLVSGGQTGVDQAALAAAIRCGLPHGGWCPKGRIAENGIIPSRYSLVETDDSGYSTRTKLNIRDSDGTLIVVPDSLKNISDGTILTMQEAKGKEKPYFIVQLSSAPSIDRITTWLAENNIKVLNVAGPRESKSPGCYNLTLSFLEHVFTVLEQDLSPSPH